MYNFEYKNPVKIIFGKGSIPKVTEQISSGSKILMTYGGGSIKQNGIFNQVKNALKDFELIEFGGIEPNPHYETCMRAIEIAKNEKVDFLLSVGGGSVLDATKFIAAGILYPGNDPWDFLKYRYEIEVKEAVPLGAILTLPATGSEMNGT